MHSPDDSACDDGIACTKDTCSQETGCAHTANDTLCEDDNVCTDDTCDPTLGCTYPENEDDCDDQGHEDPASVCSLELGVTHDDEVIPVFEDRGREYRLHRRIESS